jgi:2-hydroxychromene-2-carboxylate isomerase
MLRHMPSPLHFYFDFISPYGYFASLRIEEIAARHGRAVEWHSMLLGVSVLKVMGLKALMETPLKSDYVRLDVLRYARKHGLEFGRDVDAPIFNPLPAGRAFHWVKRHHPALAVPLAHALFDAAWREGRDLATAADVAAVHLPVGLDADELRAAIEGPEAAALLRSAVEASLKQGIFGSPMIVVDGEPFWGVERLPDVDEWLARGGW